jgi:hypothetical protein
MRAIARLSAVLILSAAIGGPAVAQAPPVEEAPGSVLVEELTVVGRPPGPPIWKVVKGDAELYVVGVVGPIHHQQTWDSRRLERVLDGADLLLAPPEAQVGPFQALRFLAGDLWRVRLGSGPRLEARLPAALRDRFVRYREAAGGKPARYEHWKPAVAGFLLLSDVRQAGGLSEAKPGSTIRRLAKARKVKVRPLAQYRLQPLVSAAGTLSDADHLACLKDVLDQLDRETGRPRELGDAWAAGDLSAVRDLQRASALDRCLRRSAKGRRVLDAQIGAAAEALAGALDRPGRTVAVVDLAYVLPLEGVLDRLRASGAEVSVPAG